MIVTKFLENRMTIDREISEKHAILVDHFSDVTFTLQSLPSLQDLDSVGSLGIANIN